MVENIVLPGDVMEQNATSAEHFIPKEKKFLYAKSLKKFI